MSNDLKSLSFTELAERAEYVGNFSGLGEMVSHIGKNDDQMTGPPASRLAVQALADIVSELCRRLGP